MRGWANTNHGSHVPEFSSALARASQMSQSWWEDKARTGLIGQERDQVHPSVWKHVVSCRFRSDYGEDRQTFAAGAGAGAKVEINYIMAPNAQPPAVQLHSHGEPVTIDIDGDE